VFVVQRLHCCNAMSAAATPREFALDNLKLVRQHWAGVLDADVESIHQARIALRRIRAALQVLYRSDSDEIELCRYLGRALGRVRDLDVMQELFAGVATRLPAAASAIAAIGRNVDNDRQCERRRLIKTLDEVELRPIACLGRRHPLRSLKFWKDWHEALMADIAARTRTLRSAADAAPAVYMPNRLHRVRIALKKLRYTLEVAEAAGASIDRHLMRDARKAQDLLGRIHDLQGAHRIVRRFDASSRSLAAEARLLDAVVTSDTAALHAKYVSRRDRVRAICDYCADLAAPRPFARAARLVLRAIPAASVAVLPVAVWRLGTAGPEGSHP
jgi:CHAD domain-containing protein